MQLHEQIAAAFEKTGWSVAEFREKSGIKIDRSQLARRLSGDTPMKTEEAELLVDALRKHGFDVAIAWPPAKKHRRAA